MDLFCSFIQVNLFYEKVGGLCISCSFISFLRFCTFLLFKNLCAFMLSSYLANTIELRCLVQIPRKMMLQMYNLLHTMPRNEKDSDSYHQHGIHWLVQLSLSVLQTGYLLRKLGLMLLLCVLSITRVATRFSRSVIKDNEFKGQALLARFSICNL